MRLAIILVGVLLAGCGCKTEYLSNEEITRQGKICLDAGMNMAQVQINGQIVCTPPKRK